MIYQNIIFLGENKFVDKWVNNYEPLIDYFELFQNKIEKKYGTKNKDEIMKKLIRISLKLKMLYDREFEIEVINKQKEFFNEVIKLKNKESYLAELSKEKRQKENKIKTLDQIMNDKNLLIEEYNKRNKKLSLENKIFSIRVLKNNLQKEREEVLKEIKNCNEIMNPKNFIKIKKMTERKFEYFDDIENLELKDEVIELQKKIIKCMYFELQNIKEKNEMIEFIYKYRYYNLLPIENRKNIYEIDKLKMSLNKLTRAMIDKSIEMKVISKLTENQEENYSITGKLLLLKIIELKNINLKLIEEEKKNYLIIYDEEIEDTRIELENITKKKLKIGNKKKTKLFI